MNIRAVLEKMIAARASDLHLKAGTPPVVRVDGILYTLDEAAPSAQELKEVCHQLLNDEQRLYFSTHNEIDFAFGVSGLARFRANIFMQRGTPALALRHVPVQIPTLEDLARKGTTQVDVACPGFVSDCLETLEEIGITAREAFLAAGGKDLNVIPCLNEAPEWIAALAQIASGPART